MLYLSEPPAAFSFNVQTYPTKFSPSHREGASRAKYAPRQHFDDNREHFRNEEKILSFIVMICDTKFNHQTRKTLGSIIEQLRTATLIWIDPIDVELDKVLSVAGVRTERQSSRIGFDSKNAGGGMRIPTLSTTRCLLYHVPVLPERLLDQMGMVEELLELAHQDLTVVMSRGDGNDVAGALLALEGNDLVQEYNQRVRNGSLKEGGIGECGAKLKKPALANQPILLVYPDEGTPNWVKNEEEETRTCNPTG
ncbi:hypothetical protein B0H13DRAFT_1922183 [Mycena leptocephala]|nr:hypothetical protein B0H13DRAFT_1922183 [Mycena leptocephala]